MERTFSIPVEQRSEMHPLDTLPRAIANYVRERPAFTARQLQDHLAEHYLISMDAKEFADELPQLLDSVAEWQADCGTPIEFVILDPEEELYTTSGGRTLVHAQGDTFAVKDMYSPAYIATITMAAGATPALPKSQPTPEALPGVDLAFSQQELHIAEIALKRLSWYTAHGGVPVSNLTKWLVEPGFSEHAAVVLVERLVQRGMLVAVDTETGTPLITLSKDVEAEVYLKLLTSHARIGQVGSEV